MYDYSFLFGVRAPEHAIKAAGYIDSYNDKNTMIEMPPRSGKTSLATSYVKALADRGKSVLYISQLPGSCFYFGPELQNITVIKKLSPLTGRSFDLVVVDDVIWTQEEGNDPNRIDKLVSWWNTVVLTHIAVEGRKIVIGTRYGKDDFMGQIKSSEWEVCTIPAIDRIGRSYWPEMFPVDRLQEIKSQIGDRLFDYLYQQGSPVYETREVARPYEV